MSLNFFKSTPQKTDATLQFNSVLDNLNEKRDVKPLNIDEFIQQENINLRSHQGKILFSRRKRYKSLFVTV